jgi:hypothetical protein
LLELELGVGVGIGMNSVGEVDDDISEGLSEGLAEGLSETASEVSVGDEELTGVSRVDVLMESLVAVGGALVGIEEGMLEGGVSDATMLVGAEVEMSVALMPLVAEGEIAVPDDIPVVDGKIPEVVAGIPVVRDTPEVTEGVSEGEIPDVLIRVSEAEKPEVADGVSEGVIPVPTEMLVTLAKSELVGTPVGCRPDVVSRSVENIPPVVVGRSVLMSDPKDESMLETMLSIGVVTGAVPVEAKGGSSLATLDATLERMLEMSGSELGRSPTMDETKLDTSDTKEGRTAGVVIVGRISKVEVGAVGPGEGPVMPGDKVSDGAKREDRSEINEEIKGIPGESDLLSEVGIAADSVGVGVSSPDVPKAVVIPTKIPELGSELRGISDENDASLVGRTTRGGDPPVDASVLLASVCEGAVSVGVAKMLVKSSSEADGERLGLSEEGASVGVGRTPVEPPRVPEGDTPGTSEAVGVGSSPVALPKVPEGVTPGTSEAEGVGIGKMPVEPPIVPEGDTPGMSEPEGVGNTPVEPPTESEGDTAGTSDGRGVGVGKMPVEPPLVSEGETPGTSEADGVGNMPVGPPIEPDGDTPGTIESDGDTGKASDADGVGNTPVDPANELDGKTPEASEGVAPVGLADTSVEPKASDSPDDCKGVAEGEAVKSVDGMMNGPSMVEPAEEAGCWVPKDKLAETKTSGIPPVEAIADDAGEAGDSITSLEKPEGDASSEEGVAVESNEGIFDGSTTDEPVGRRVLDGTSPVEPITGTCVDPGGKTLVKISVGNTISDEARDGVSGVSAIEELGSTVTDGRTPVDATKLLGSCAAVVGTTSLGASMELSGLDSTLDCAGVAGDDVGKTTTGGTPPVEPTFVAEGPTESSTLLESGIGVTTEDSTALGNAEDMSLGGAAATELDGGVEDSTLLDSGIGVTTDDSAALGNAEEMSLGGAAATEVCGNSGTTERMELETMVSPALDRSVETGIGGCKVHTVVVEPSLGVGLGEATGIKVVPMMIDVVLSPATAVLTGLILDDSTIGDEINNEDEDNRDDLSEDASAGGDEEEPNMDSRKDSN